MRNLNWPGPVINKKSPDYEWAYVKAYLESESNERAENTYSRMWGEKPKKGTPYWLVRLAVYYGALEIGYKRIKRPMPSIEQRMLSCVSKLNENELRNNVVLWHHMCLHDIEPACFSGRELVS